MLFLNSIGRLWLLSFAIGLALLLVLQTYWLASGGNQVRRPHFAGRWYFGNREHLAKELEQFSKQVENTGLTGAANVRRLIAENNAPGDHVVALICPHAALRFSGLAAAHSYAMLKAKQPDVGRIFLLGPVHFQNLSGAYLPESRVFATPLGDLTVDRDVLEKLKTNSLFKTDETVHSFEHSLELQLPFIRHNFPRVKLVPILIGRNTSAAQLQNIGQTIRANLNADDVVVVSSDFTHWGKYYNYVPFNEDVPANIQALDKQAVAAIAKRDYKQFEAFRQATKDTICGFNPIFVLLTILPPDSSCTVLDYYRSQEPAGQEEVLDREMSISYVSAAFFAKGWRAN